MKKIRFLLLSCLMALPATALAQSPMTGDVNGDGTVNITDLNAVINMIIDGSDTTPMADVNGDGSVNIADVNAIISIIIDGPVVQEEDDYVDLGLPSGTLWATRNVGASYSYEYGDKFAWGEVEPKGVYEWSTYKWCNGSDSTLTKYNSRSDWGLVDNKTELEPEDDAAHVNWGPEWQMPSSEQMYELVEQCKWQYINRNGVDGTLFTGPNGNTMFLPYRMTWSRTRVYLLDGAAVSTTEDRHLGNAVRAVRKSPVDRPDVYIEQSSLELGCVTIGKSCTGQLTIVNNSPDSITLTTSTEAPFSFMQKEDTLLNMTAVVPGNSRDTVTVMFTTTTPGDCSGDVIFKNPVLDGGQIVIPVHAIAFTNVIPKEDFVDLGLPSGTLWATCNVGANSPEETGYRLAWGETEPKVEYTWNSYKWYDGFGLTKYCLNNKQGTVDGKTELDLEDDAAYVNWGPQWRMPSHEQMEELSKYCIWKRTIMNGEKGCLLTGPNGNTIFLPASYVGYWSRTLHLSHNFEVYLLDRYSRVCFGYRLDGYSVRAVREPLTITPHSLDMEEVYLGDAETAALTLINNTHDSITLTATVDAPFRFKQNDESVSSMTIVIPGDSSITVTVMFKAVAVGDFNGNVTFRNSAAHGQENVIQVHARAIPVPIPWEEYVDLGLPSGTLWATMNIGADRPQAYGDYFAWGETEPKEDYSWKTYKWCDGSGDSLTKYCTDSVHGTVDNMVELEPQDDAAYVNWGPSWRIPTLEQHKELINHCTWTWTTSKGVYGYRVTGPNQNSIFLPAAGYRIGTMTSLEGTYGDFWSRTLSNGYSDYACDMYYFDATGVHWATSGRFMGFTLRAVRAEPDVYIMPRSLDLGEVPVGETREGELTIVNNTTESVILTATVHEPFSFKQDEGNTSTMTLVVPVGSCKLSVMFTATAPVTHAQGLVTFQGSALEGGECVIPVQAVVKYSSDYVDLGLSSGTLWATRNIGANSPEEYGDYFAWGETAPKEVYTVQTYKWGGYDSEGQFYLSKYNSNSGYGTIDNKNELDPEDDAAYVNWGASWRMPSDEQIQELISICTWKWTQSNGVNGKLFTGPNGNTLFLPAAGIYYSGDNSFRNEGSIGEYWSRMLNPSDDINARALGLSEKDIHYGGSLRAHGFTVRAVRASHN